jgi:nucleotide-binding universal stress UspA family protein
MKQTKNTDADRSDQKEKKSIRILIALSTSRYSQSLVSSAFEEIQKQKNKDPTLDVLVDVIYIIEVEELQNISNRVGNEAFLGVSIQQDVLKALEEEHHRVAKQRIEDIRKKTQEVGCPFFLEECEGNFSEKVLTYAESKTCEVIFLTRDDRPFISRFLFGSDADKVAKLAKKEGLGKVVIDDRK